MPSLVVICHRLALVEQPRHVWLHRCSAKPSVLRCQQCGEPDVQRARPFKPTAPRADRRTQRRECRADSTGNVYVANGQIFVYDPADRMIGEIDVPERPIDILFGGPDRWTLFILGHHTLYAVKTRAFGEPFAWVK